MKLRGSLSLILFGTALSLLGSEVLLRLLGESAGEIPVPIRSLPQPLQAPFSPNAKTGWQLKPGTYQLTLGERGRTTRVTIRNDGSRITQKLGTYAPEGLPRIILIGDSYIFGEGLDDQETLPWRLQELLPDRLVINHGIGGFGTCQAFLRLQQLQEEVSSGSVIVYGLSSFHEERNTADPRLDYWIALSSPSHTSGYPRCRAVNDTLLVDPPRTWEPLLPLTGWSTLSKVLTNAWLTLRARGAIAEQRSVTVFLLKQMSNFAKLHRSSFIVLLQDLSPEARTHYQILLKSSSINFVDGTEVDQGYNLRLPDGHPGPDLAQRWAEMLSVFISSKG